MGAVPLSDALSWKPPDYSDAGNAVALVNECHGLLAFCDALGWLNWTGTHWAQDDHKAVERAVDLTVHMIAEAQVELEAAYHLEAAAKLALAQKESSADELAKQAKRDIEQAKAYFGHATRSRNVAKIKGISERYCPASAVFRGGERTHQHPSAAGRGHSGNKGQGCPLWQTAQTAPGELPQHLPAVESRGHHWHSGGERVRDAAVHLPLPGGDLRKGHVIVKGVFLQERVLFCEVILAGRNFPQGIENPLFFW